jgi:hypothetical protein
MCDAVVTCVLAHQTIDEVSNARSACPNDPSCQRDTFHLEIFIAYMASIEHAYTVTQSQALKREPRANEAK